MRITWVKSTIGYNRKQRRIIESLGLHRLHAVVEKEGSPSIRGMVHKVRHLVRVEEVKE